MRASSIIIAALASLVSAGAVKQDVQGISQPAPKLERGLEERGLFCNPHPRIQASRRCRKSCFRSGGQRIGLRQHDCVWPDTSISTRDDGVSDDGGVADDGDDGNSDVISRDYDSSDSIDDPEYNDLYDGSTDNEDPAYDDGSYDDGAYDERDDEDTNDGGENIGDLADSSSDGDMLEARYLANPTWHEGHGQLDSPYHFTLEYANGGQSHMTTSSLSSKCHTISEGPQKVAYVLFDRGWVEDEFFLYSDQFCQDLVFHGKKGGYTDWAETMVGSWRVD